MAFPNDLKALTATARTGLAARLAPGIAVAVILAFAATFVAEHYGGPQLLYALLFGMVFHFLIKDERCQPGIDFTGRTVLRIGVALLGIRIGVEEVAALGLTGAGIVAGAVAGTIAIGWFAARWLGLGRDVGLLTGGSVAICGASAALAISTVLPDKPGKDRATLFTVVAVTTLSTLAMIFYPALVRLLELGMGEAGLFLGGTIHDVAQVVGAGYIVSEETGDTATVTKLFRVALLAPAVIVIGLILGQARAGAGSGAARGALLPWFLVVFILLAVLHSTGVVPSVIEGLLADASRWALVLAIAAIGVKTSLEELKTVGWRPMALVVLETLFIAAVVLAAIFVLR